VKKFMAIVLFQSVLGRVDPTGRCARGGEKEIPRRLPTAIFKVWTEAGGIHAR